MKKLRQRIGLLLLLNIVALASIGQQYPFLRLNDSNFISQEDADAFMDSISNHPFVVTPDMMQEDIPLYIPLRDFEYKGSIVGKRVLHNSLPSGELLGHSLTVVLLTDEYYMSDKQIIKEIRSLSTLTSDYMFIRPSGDFYTYKGKNKAVDYELDVVYGSYDLYTPSGQSYRYVYMTNKRNGYKPHIKTH